jgi:hypothetical protein
MNLAQLACPLCGGAFQVELTWQGHQVTCPHCEQVVTVPNLDPLTPPDFATTPPPVGPTNPNLDASAPADFVAPPPPVERANPNRDPSASPDFIAPSPPVEQTSRTADKHPVEQPPQIREDEVPPADTPKSSRSKTTAAVDNYILSRRRPAENAGGSPFAIHETPKQVVDHQGHTVELKSRTPDQKARFRRRLHATVAIASAVVLAILLGSLLLL